MPNGEILPMNNNVKVLFEGTDLADVTPAIVSSAGMVHFPELDWESPVSTLLRRVDPKFLPLYQDHLLPLLSAHAVAFHEFLVCPGAHEGGGAGGWVPGVSDVTASHVCVGHGRSGTVAGAQLRTAGGQRPTADGSPPTADG